MSKVPFQLLELTIISAQDLSLGGSKNLKTYAVTWVNPDRKLRTKTHDQGGTNPTWNDRFVFRVDETFLNSDTSSVKIEISSVGWIRDNIVGYVRVMIKNLIPPEIRQEKSSSRRFVALQIRRPSGRPQGILNVGVSLLDNTMRSMPLSDVLSAPPTTGAVDSKKLITSDEKVKLRRSLSDNIDLKREQGRTDVKQRVPQPNGSIVNYQPVSVVNGGGGSIVNGVGSIVNGGPVVNGGSMVNGSFCNSDVGPSPSVVAAAVAMGLYPTQLGPPPKPGSSVLEDWRVEESSMEFKSKIDRWRMDIPPKFDNRYQRLENNNRRQRRHTRGRRKTADNNSGSGLFSCLAFGCEFTIVCGNNNGRRKKNGEGYGNEITLSELDS